MRCELNFKKLHHPTVKCFSTKSTAVCVAHYVQLRLRILGQEHTIKPQ